MSTSKFSFDYRMDYDPEKRLHELTRLINGYVKVVNERTPFHITCPDVDFYAKRVVALYNDIVHYHVKDHIDVNDHGYAYVSRGKVIAASQFSIMAVLPLKPIESNSNKISIQRANANLCWALYISMVLDFPSLSELQRNAKSSGTTNRHFRADEEFEKYRDDYIHWLITKNRAEIPIFISSWYLDLFTDKFLYTIGA